MKLFFITNNVFKCCFPFTAGSGLIHGRHARILARIFGVRSEGRGEGGEEKYSFPVQQGQKNIVLQLYRGSKDLLGKNLDLFNPSF